MKNKFFLLFLFFLISSNAYSLDQFDFNVTELKILENGNKIIGSDRGIITSNNGVVITANQFEYYKKLNVLYASGDVKIIDNINDYVIYSQEITYKKNENLIITNNNSRAIDSKAGIQIDANSFEYNLVENIITAKKNATINNKLKKFTISSNFISYLRNDSKIFTKGETTAFIEPNYKFKSFDVTFLTDLMELSSNNKTSVYDKTNFYTLEKFSYLINKEELKGTKILINSNYNLPTSDKFYFSSAIINLKKKSFVGKDTSIKVYKGIFNNLNNDPRIVGTSASSQNGITRINKGVFTSCEQNDKCPPWSIQAKEIIHDKNKKEIIYNDALLKIYDFPILYFPKFFHPDPTVNRRSGFLKPQLNNSDTQGNSFSIPYFSVLAENKDYTFIPSIFENNLQMFQNEYRQINKNSEVYANFGFVNNYNSSLDSKKNSIFNLFANYKRDLNFKNFYTSNLNLSIEKITNDTFLKIFDTHLQNNILKPKDFDNLKSEIKISLKKDSYNFESGFISYENLQKTNSDRYEYVLPYYNFSSTLSDNLFNGTINISSSGDSILNDTNKIKSKITNDITYRSSEYISFGSLKSSYGANIKNLNSVGKKNSDYKSSPKIELMSELIFNSSIPLIKEAENNFNYLTPKVLFKINPNEMKDYNNSDKTIDINNIFNNNRLGLNDTLEAGASLTVGLDYKKEKIDDINKFFEIKLSTVFRDKEENLIPKKTTINQKNSNVFGSISNNFSDFFNINYKFAVDEDLNNIEYNEINTEIVLNKFTTKFNFIEENGVMGNSNIIENNSLFNFNEKNYLTFKTRRNRKLNLTEYYDLVYEYKNDCLTAGIKYKKTFYEDRDLKPTENLFFTISLIPLTSYEQKIDR